MLSVQISKEEKVVFHPMFGAVAENFQVAQIPMELGQSWAALPAAPGDNRAGECRARTKRWMAHLSCLNYSQQRQ